MRIPPPVYRRLEQAVGRPFKPTAKAVAAEKVFLMTIKYRHRESGMVGSDAFLGKGVLHVGGRLCMIRGLI